MSSLKLMVKDLEDLTVLSSLLQDATVLIGDMGYDPDHQQFMMVAARFIKEADHGDHQTAKRRLIGINFNLIDGLKRKGFSPKDSDDVLNLLAIRSEGDHIDLVFSGAAMVRLETKAINVYAADLGEGWTTQFTPTH